MVASQHLHVTLKGLTSGATTALTGGLKEFLIAGKKNKIYQKCFVNSSEMTGAPNRPTVSFLLSPPCWEITVLVQASTLR